MNPELARLLAPLLERFARVRRAIRVLYVADGVAALLIAVCIYAAVVPVLDWLLYLPQGIRVVFLLVAAAALLWLAARRVLRPIGIPITDDDLAVYVERTHPHLRDRLLAALQLARSDPEREAHFSSPELVRHFVKRTAADLAAVAPERILRRRGVVQTCAVALAVAAVVGGGWAAVAVKRPAEFAAAWRRLLGFDSRWPQRTFLEVEGFDPSRRAIVPKGDSFTVRVRVSGRRARAVLRFEYAGTQERRTVPMARGEDPREFSYGFDSVMDPIRLFVEAGDAREGPFEIIVLPRPRVDSAEFIFDYPDYILPDQILRRGLPPEGAAVPAGNFRDIPFDTRIVVRGTTNVELRRATATLLGRQSVTELRDDAAGRARFAFEFPMREEHMQVEISLSASNGLEALQAVRFDLRGRPDDPPSLEVVAPSTDEYVSARCRYPVRLVARDDYGVAGIVFAWSSSPAAGEWNESPFGPQEVSPGMPAETVRGAKTFDLEPMGLRENDWVLLRFRATDNRRVEGELPNAHETREFRLTVVSDDRLSEELQAKVDEVKRRLERARLLQESVLRSTTDLRGSLSAVEELAAGEKARLGDLERDEMSIRAFLVEARREIARVRERGDYNRLFDESSLTRLDAAIAELDALAGTDEAPGSATLAAAHALGEAARVRSGSERRRILAQAEDHETTVIQGITRVLDLLGRWTSYQEVVRVFRQILDMQRMVGDLLRGRQP